MLDDPNLRLLEVSQKMGDGPDPYTDYVKSHIKSAIYFDMHLCKDQKSQFPGMMPTPAYFTQIMKAMNIRKSHSVVIYDRQG